MHTSYDKFGVMVDCSRNGVMTVDAVKRLINCLQKMNYNTLELYTEDTYEVEGEPVFGYLRGRYTAEEIKEMDAYAQSHGIELIPCIQTLAHFDAFVRNHQVADIVDIDHVLLVGEEKVYRLIDNIFATLAQNFSSRNVNIGMDEAVMLGRGQYLTKHGYTNAYDVLLEHLHKVVDIAHKYGFKIHMWSDTFFRIANKGEYCTSEVVDIPEHVKNSVPENVDLVFWGYYEKQKRAYDVMFESHKAFAGETWFAGTAWTSRGFAPFNAYALATMKPAMQSVRDYGVKNVLITMWGDGGNECSPFAVLPALYTIRQYAEGNFDDEKIQRDFSSLFGISYPDFMTVDLPNRFSCEDKDSFVNPCKCLLYADPFLGLLDTVVENSPMIPYGQYNAILTDVASRAGEFGYIFTALASLCSVLEIKATLGVRTRHAYVQQDKNALGVLVEEYRELVKRLEDFHLKFYQLWHKDRKPQGWEISDARIGGCIQRIKTCAMKIVSYLNGELSTIEELDDEILDYPELMLNDYAKLVSRCILEL